MFQSVDRFANQSPAVIAGDDLDSRRQRSFDLRQLFLDAIDHVECIETVAHDHNTAHSLAFTVPLGNTFADIWAEGNRAEIFDEYGRAALCHHGHVPEIIQRFQVTE